MVPLHQVCGRTRFARRLPIPKASVLSKVAVMVPIGFLMCIAARGYAGRAAIARGFLFAFGIELAQVFIYSRSASTTDVILGTLGAAFGVALARTCGPAAPKPIQDTWFWRTFGWPLKLAATFSAFAAVAWTKCWPFNLAWPPEGAVEHCVAALQVPFFYHYYTTEFMAAIMVARVAGAYFVLGLLLKSLLGPTRWPRRCSGLP